MSIYEFIDICYHNRSDIPDDLCYELPKAYSQESWVDAGIFFLTNLNKHHDIPGKITETMVGICQWYKEKEFITNEQKIYLAMNIIDHWDQLDPVTFIQLNL